MELAKEFGYLDRSIFYYYGATEPEPSFPLTRNNYESIRKAFEYAARYDALKGVMTHAQTLLVQLPNVAYFSRFAWGGVASQTDELNARHSLTKSLFPENGQVLAEGWGRLSADGSAAALAGAERLDALVKHGNLGRAGTVGSFVFPERTLVVRDLATMLRIHGTAERVREQVAASSSQTEVTEALEAYFREMLEWQKRNGFFGAYGAGKRVVFDNFVHGSDAETVRTAWKHFTENRADRAQLEAGIVQRLSRYGYADSIVKAVTGQLFGTYRMTSGDENPVFRQLPPNLNPWLRSP